MMIRWSKSHTRETYINSQKIIDLSLEREIIFVRIAGGEEKRNKYESPEIAKKQFQSMLEQINNAQQASSDEFSRLQQEIVTLKQSLKLQQEQLESLNQALLYAPGGPIYQISHQNYQTRSSATNPP